MRLSTVEPRDPERAVAVIHTALDAGATLLDSADAYCLDDSEIGHNERLIAHALKTWRGDSARITVATKGGLVRPGGRWLPDGRAKHLHDACAASLRALDVCTIDLYQLHAVDSRVPIATSVRALAELQRLGMIRRIGLSNVTVSQIKSAQKLADISSVQVSLSVLDDENLRNGVVEYCRDHGIQLIAYRPVGGKRSGRLARHPVLCEIAKRHDVTPHEIALAWLLDLGPHVVPIPGATREATARSIERVIALHFTDDDRTQLDECFRAGRLLRSSRSVIPRRAGEVVMVMGMPGAGKTSTASEFVERGYRRLNRDTAGGKLVDLVSELDSGLANGEVHWVLDNTYASRKSRNEVIECAARHGVGVRCVRLNTSVADAQINAVSRLIEAHGCLPMPEEIRKLGRSDHRYFGPDAQFRYERQVEPPVVDEGFVAIEDRVFVRTTDDGIRQKAIVLEYDAVLFSEDGRVPDNARQLVQAYGADGFKVFAIAWRPQVSDGQTTEAAVIESFERTKEQLGMPIEFAFCPHAAGPPICWCRKPLPGLILQFAFRHRLALKKCVLIGRSTSDRTLASRLGMIFREAQP